MPTSTTRSPGPRATVTTGLMLALLTLWPDPVAAQGASLDGRFLAGVTLGSVATIDSNLGTQYRLSPFVRWNPKRRGWGPSFGLSWYTADLRVPVGGDRAAAASIQVRPVMAGVGYSIVSGRLRTTVGLVGGYAFNRVRADRPLPDGASAVVDVRNAWAAGPKVDLLVAVSRRVALVGSLSYVFADPDISVSVWQGGRQTYAASDHARADAVSVRIGAAVSLF